MWQEEAVEIIRLFQNTAITSQQDASSLHKRVQEFRQTMDMQTDKLRDADRLVQSNIFAPVLFTIAYLAQEEKERLELAMTRQKLIEELIQELEQKITTTTEEFAQEDVLQKIHPPQILTELKDAQVFFFASL